MMNAQICDETEAKASVVVNQRAFEVPAEVGEALVAARVLLRTALANSKHTDFCERMKFWQHNKHLPAGHPAWKASPNCNCWHAEAINFLMTGHQ